MLCIKRGAWNVAIPIIVSYLIMDKLYNWNLKRQTQGQEDQHETICFWKACLSKKGSKCRHWSIQDLPTYRKWDKIQTLLKSNTKRESKTIFHKDKSHSRHTRMDWRTSEQTIYQYILTSESWPGKNSAINTGNKTSVNAPHLIQGYEFNDRVKEHFSFVK